ncbi:MAG: histidinol-phosphate transaminase [Proteobacteria bacterium]|nr:histidinol-phosphate transaminase [Pseudomonadota bacterium]
MKKFNLQSIVRDNIKKLKPYQAKEIPCRIKMDANESPFSVRLSEVIKEIDIPLNRYPDPEAMKLRKSISKRFKINLNNIMIGNGSDELIYYLILTFGGPVLYPIPTFAMYGIIAQSVGVQTLESKLDKNFDINEKEFIDLIKTKKPSLIFLSTPNNPTGNTFSSEKILKIIEIAYKRASIVVIDEAYHPFCSEKGFLPFLRDFDNLLILRTLSKIGFAGLRIGYLIGHEKILNEISKVRLPYNVDSLTQCIATYALDNFYSNIKRFIKEIVKEREILQRELSKLKGIKVYPSEANFILFKAKNSKEIYQKLMKSGILIRDMSANIKDALRVTVGTKEENAEFIKTLKNILEGYR